MNFQFKMVVMLNDTSKMQGEAFVGYTNISLHATFIPMPSHIGWTMVIMHLKNSWKCMGCPNASSTYIHTSLLISIAPRKHLASKGLY
jgi:hypothetical protein